MHCTRCSSPMNAVAIVALRCAYINYTIDTWAWCMEIIHCNMETLHQRSVSYRGVPPTMSLHACIASAYEWDYSFWLQVDVIVRVCRSHPSCPAAIVEQMSIHAFNGCLDRAPAVTSQWFTNHLSKIEFANEKIFIALPLCIVRCANQHKYVCNTIQHHPFYFFCRFCFSQSIYCVHIRINKQ